MGIIKTIKMLAKEEGEVEGLEKGREEEKVIIVKHLLKNSGFDVEKISFLTGVAKEFIEK
ncbi:hypothetical protein ACFP1I_20135 [Dyadobacter subterraneus]|uniref:Transposase n=1 Tax=Dyadobacter subterraneus TaxID=2773304 RepID=A0ABR9W5U6_9BACT|nr:hypothetical protein [Dyadobacter subterraneus]MBE9460837.1 hypothetical protein [Dyadobacter subterraneus]